MKKLFLLVVGAAFAIALTAFAPVTAFADTNPQSSGFDTELSHQTKKGLSQ